MTRSHGLVLVLFELNELLEVKDPRVVFEGTLNVPTLGPPPRLPMK